MAHRSVLEELMEQENRASLSISDKGSFFNPFSIRNGSWSISSFADQTIYIYIASRYSLEAGTIAVNENPAV